MSLDYGVTCRGCGAEGNHIEAENRRYSDDGRPWGWTRNMMWRCPDCADVLPESVPAMDKKQS